MGKVEQRRQGNRGIKMRVETGVAHLLAIMPIGACPYICICR